MDEVKAEAIMIATLEDRMSTAARALRADDAVWDVMAGWARTRFEHHGLEEEWEVSLDALTFRRHGDLGQKTVEITVAGPGDLEQTARAMRVLAAALLLAGIREVT